jgi:hypothetical protein
VRKALPALVFVILTACPNTVPVALKTPASVSDLTFMVGDARTAPRKMDAIDVFAVSTCALEERELVWRIERTPVRGGPLPLQIAYGKAPAEWHVSYSARPLSPGCYSATVGGLDAGISGGISFDVDSLGHVQPH